MATLKSKRKLAAVARESQEGRPRNSQSRNTAVPRINEDYITRVSEEIESRLTKKLSRDRSRTENRILGALSKLVKFSPNLQSRAQFGTVLATSRNSNTENEDPNMDRSHNDSRPEVGTFIYQSPQSTNVDPEEASYIWHFSSSLS